ncbi:sulfur carrier protein ThiS [Brevibacterium atlanticum]|uniref:sulfur carrier protein ThiS n=1 Tax=Brevibacterium atlanticum TaxID=2697563 RepID=UPI001420A119|nr:sulfur carrier protein ThiS [Brevibacterium atlanticum]
MTDTAHAPTIVVNGDERELGGTTSVLDLVAEVIGRELSTEGTPADGGRLGIAVAVDGEVVRRGRWADFALADGHAVDIVTAVQGG